MGQLERIVLEVPAEVADALREAVAAGQHGSVEEAAREAIDAWYFDRVAPWLSDEDLGRMWDEGIASGPGEEAHVVFARIRARLAAGAPPAASERLADDR